MDAWAVSVAEGPFRAQSLKFFLVVAAASDAADLIDCARLHARQCREYFRNER